MRSTSHIGPAVTLVLIFAGSLRPQESRASAPTHPGGRIACAKLVEGTWQVCEADLAGGSVRQLTTGLPDKRSPAHKIGGSICWHDVNLQVALQSPGSGAAPPFLKKYWPVRDLAWSPDGKRVVFTRVRTDLIDASNLWIADADGGNARTLTTSPGVQWQAAWSPAGDRIVFSAGQGYASYEIWVVGADGQGLKRLTEDQKLDFLPAWSPDGKRIAWSSDATGDYEIWSMNADGSDRRQLTRSPGIDTRPAWSPDGSHLAFASTRSGRFRIWTMRADGGDTKSVDVLGDDVCDPAWAPESSGRDRVDAARRVVGLPPASPEAADPRPVLVHGGVEPKAFDPAAKDAAAVRFRIERRASVAVDFVDRRGVLVRRLDLGPVDPGSGEAAWDGRDFMGRPVPPGVYRYFIRAEEESGAIHRYDGAGTGGEQMAPREFSFDPPTRRFDWIMPRAGLAFLRVGTKGSPFLGAVLDWEAFPAGRQQLFWDGFDASKLVDLRQHPELEVVMWLWAIPDNAVIVRGKAEPGGWLRADPSYPAMTFGEGAFLHARHPPETCHQTRFTVEFLDNTEKDRKGNPVVRGVVPVRVAVDPRDRAQVLDLRHEIAIYVDLVFLFEEEQGADPFTFLWDTTRLPPGEHLLTIDVIGYDDHFGVITRQVVVAPPQ